MVRLLLVLLLIACDQRAQVYKKSNYYNDLDRQLDIAQAYFEKEYNYKFKRDFKDFVVFDFFESQEDMQVVCKSDVPVTGCIVAYWRFVIWDHPDYKIRCQTVLHESGHVALAMITNGLDLDYAHNNKYFTTFVFDEANCKL